MKLTHLKKSTSVDAACIGFALNCYLRNLGFDVLIGLFSLRHFKINTEILNTKEFVCHMKPTGVPHMGSTALYYISYGCLVLTPIALGLDDNSVQCFPEYQLCARHCARQLGRNWD